MSRMSDLDIEMQEMLERGASVEDVASCFEVPVQWAEQAFANLLQSHQEQFNDNWFEQGSLVKANAECQIVAEEQRQAEMEEYVAMIQQGGKTL